MNKENNYFNDSQKLLENIMSPQDFFEKMFSKDEISKIIEESEYYFQNDNFINAVKMFKPKKLLERLKEEEREIKKSQ